MGLGFFCFVLFLFQCTVGAKEYSPKWMGTQRLTPAVRGPAGRRGLHLRRCWSSPAAPTAPTKAPGTVGPERCAAPGLDERLQERGGCLPSPWAGHRRGLRRPWLRCSCRHGGREGPERRSWKVPACNGLSKLRRWKSQATPSALNSPAKAV